MQELKRSDKLFIPNTGGTRGGKYWSLLMMFQLKPSFELFEVELGKPGKGSKCTLHSIQCWITQAQISSLTQWRSEPTLSDKAGFPQSCHPLRLCQNWESPLFLLPFFQSFNIIRLKSLIMGSVRSYLFHSLLSMGWSSVGWCSETPPSPLLPGKNLDIIRVDSTPPYNQHTIQGKLNTSSELQELGLAENCHNTVSYIYLATVHYTQRHWTKCWVLMF
jgi:hypothetical protein